MPLFEYPELVCVQISWMAIASRWMLRRNDEIPLLISSLLFYVTGYRYWAVTSGLNDWVNLSQFGIGFITQSEVIEALTYLVLGQSCFLAAYIVYQRQKIPIVKPIALGSFMQWLSPRILIFGVLCLPLVLLARSNVNAQLRAGNSLAFQVNGYLQQFPFILVGIATLIMCLWKFGCMSARWHKLTAVIILLGVASLTFRESGRFQLIGWLSTAGIIFSSSFKPTRRLILLGSFLLLTISVFAIAGALRGDGAAVNLQTVALDRFIGAEDANMLDGFVLLRRFIPHVVPYRLGMTHLEILMRPIPRALWPGKPAGGSYMVQAGLSNSDDGYTVGISPTLFGDFYSEGGVIAMLLLAIFYGILLAKIVSWTVWLHPFAGVLVRAIICAALVPILRGGDLAGIIAWLGMAFWPCFLLLWLKRKEFDTRALYRKWCLAAAGIAQQIPR
jgi:oligosaccharide repeat unit polymerase